MHQKLRLVLSVGSLAVALWACGTGPAFSSGFSSANAGARTGGAQDIALARSKVDSGVVPAPGDFALEGVYAESDIQVSGPACQQTFCLSASTALAPEALPNAPTEANPTTNAWVSLGMASNVDLSTFHRRALNAALIIDTSCSMGTQKMEAVKAAAEKLVDQLGPDDLLTLVRFDDVARTVIGPLAVTDRDQFKQSIRTLSATAGTCIECGLRTGFTELHRNLDETRSARAFLLTDAIPNVKGTRPNDFLPLLKAEADQGVAVTSFGVGLDFGQELTTAIQNVRGANSYFLADEERTRTIFDNDFDLMVTPVAYDLHLTMTPAAGVSFQALYGVPGQVNSTFDSTVATVFLSRTHGALVAKFAGTPPGAALGEATISYVGLDGLPVSGQLTFSAPATSPGYTTAGVRKAVTLTRFALGARLACEQYASGDKTTASKTIAGVVQLLDAEATEMADADLRREAAFAAQLAAVISR